MRLGDAARSQLASALIALAAVVATPADASPSPFGGDPGRLCADAIARQERSGVTPRHLLTAIALNESGRKDPVTGARVAWPWAVMAEGRGRYLPTKAAAIAEVRGLQANGVRNIDVGCMQINLFYHPDAFRSLEEAFDPATNVAYAADYLRELFYEKGSWQEAAGRYHSATPEHKIPYQNRVVALWDKFRDGREGETELAALMPPPPLTGSRSPGLGRSTDASVDRFVRQIRMPTVRRGSAAPVPAPVDQPGLVRVPPRTAQLAARDSAGEAEFAARRAQYMQAWRQARAGGAGGPVTVVRGTAEHVYSFDIR